MGNGPSVVSRPRQDPNGVDARHQGQKLATEGLRTAEKVFGLALDLSAEVMPAIPGSTPGIVGTVQAGGNAENLSFHLSAELRSLAGNSGLLDSLFAGRESITKGDISLRLAIDERIRTAKVPGMLPIRETLTAEERRSLQLLQRDWDQLPGNTLMRQGLEVVEQLGTSASDSQVLQAIVKQATAVLPEVMRGALQGQPSQNDSPPQLPDQGTRPQQAQNEQAQRQTLPRLTPHDFVKLAESTFVKLDTDRSRTLSIEDLEQARRNPTLNQHQRALVETWYRDFVDVRDRVAEAPSPLPKLDPQKTLSLSDVSEHARAMSKDQDVVFGVNRAAPAPERRTATAPVIELHEFSSISQRLFTELDADGDNRLGKKELALAAQSHKYSGKEAQVIAGLYKYADKIALFRSDDSGSDTSSLSRDDIASFGLEVADYLRDAEVGRSALNDLHNKFSRFDFDKNGYITDRELLASVGPNATDAERRQVSYLRRKFESLQNASNDEYGSENDG
ncbi:MAG: hypothetical protein KDD69_17775, partial [Bdellovibrionales bacterium]|nr:hypothetical protein [Bdellovibrionales bacterium]